MYCQRCGTQIPDESSFCNSCGLDVTSIGRPAGSPDQPAPAVDEIEHVREALKDEYEILSELGRGGMAIVFRALEKGLDREVAVKVLPASMGFDAEFVERFQREARTAAKLEHPSIIPIYRVGQSGRVIYFVMKFLRGKSLADLVENGALDPGELRRLLSETASALGYAHKNGIVHRDIKPDNILLDDTGRAIITDFGIAKAATGAKLTGTGMAIGTPHYMSPEQARATPLDGRSDIYSLGVCAYQCLTGKVPFDGTDAFSIGYKHITETPPEPELGSDSQRDLYEVIKKMMEKEPDDRFQSAEDLCLALDGGGPAFRSTDTLSNQLTTPMRASSAQRLVSAAEAAASVTPTTPMPSADFQLPNATGGPAVTPPTDKAEKKGRGGALIAAALLVVVVGGGGGGWFYYKNFFDRGTNPSVERTAAATNAAQEAILPPGNDAATPAPPAVVDSTQGQPAGTTDPDSTGLAAADDSAATPAPVEVAATTGVLVLRGMPGAAQVKIDGADVRGGTHELSPGTHRLEVRSRGRVDYSRDVEITLGDTTDLLVEMARVPVRTSPAATCDGPGPGYNVDNLCFDVAPSALAAPLVPLTSDVQGTPPPVTLWVNVAPDGTASEVRNVGQPDPAHIAFFTLAVNYANGLRYNPAQKGGAAVAGWYQLQLVPQPR